MSTPPVYTDAITSLRPTSSFSLTEDNVVIWKDVNAAEPSTAEIEAEFSRLQADFDAKQYQRDRKGQYPPIGDQLDMQYHDLADGTTTWVDHIAAVKAAHPKP
jgi:hypothetical protein